MTGMTWDHGLDFAAPFVKSPMRLRVSGACEFGGRVAVMPLVARLYNSPLLILKTQSRETPYCRAMTVGDRLSRMIA